MALFDTHCHLDLLCQKKDFIEDINNLLPEKLIKNNIKYICQIATYLQSSLFSTILPNLSEKNNIEVPKILKQNYKRDINILENLKINELCNIYYAIGLHPSSHKKIGTLDEIIQLAKDKKDDIKFAAIGEIGLDFYWHKDDESHKRQHDIFMHFLKLSVELNKPIVVHCRDAYDEVYNILKKNHNGNGIIHCYTSNSETALKFCELGYMISFSGVVTFNSAPDIQDAAKKIPLDKMLIETDAPYLAPVPKRGKTNIPAYVKYTMEHIASLRDMNTLELENILESNSLRIYGITK